MQRNGGSGEIMKIVYVSRNKMYVCNNGKVSELPCERAEKYTTAVNEINKNKEWKHQGAGAAFREDMRSVETAPEKLISINGICAADEGSRVQKERRLAKSSRGAYLYGHGQEHRRYLLQGRQDSRCP